MLETKEYVLKLLVVPMSKSVVRQLPHISLGFGEAKDFDPVCWIDAGVIGKDLTGRVAIIGIYKSVTSIFMCSWSGPIKRDGPLITWLPTEKEIPFAVVP